jgi:hypothetical protein
MGWRSSIALAFCWTFTFALPAVGQTIVEMDVPSATKILQSHHLALAVPFLVEISNNYRKYVNVRIHSTLHKEELAKLAEALRTDFDGSGTGYIPDHTVWSVFGNTGARVLLTASLLDRNAVLLASDIDYLKGMLAFELKEGLRRGLLSLDQARQKAVALGIEMEVSETESGGQQISFFGHRDLRTQMVAKLVVIEPPELVWE